MMQKLCGLTIALIALAAMPAGAQTLIHRYRMNGGAADSVGGLDGQVVGNVTFSTSPSGNGVATFPGGNSSGSPSAPSYIRLPTRAVDRLQDATVEIYVTRFSGGTPSLGGANGYYQALFDLSSPYTTGRSQTNYAVLAANRDPKNWGGGGIGLASRTDNGPENIVSSGSPMPTSGGLVTLVFAGFHGVGSVGTETLYVNGELIGHVSTVFSFADIAAGHDGVGTAGIGGGSPFNDPTFNGGITEVRFWDGALSPSQVKADFLAGPTVVAATAKPPAVPPRTTPGA